jgi:hypothetical protein
MELTGKNYPKYYSYKFAYGQINRALESEFFLEAITIEESILADRLLGVLRNQGFAQPVNKTTLGGLIKFIRDNKEDVIKLVPDKPFTYLNSLESFWTGRNTCIHQIAKAEPGEKPIGIMEFLTIAQMTAQTGKKLCRDISSWSKAYKNIHIKNI